MCTLCGVARLNVYLPDDLAAEAKKAGVNVSAVAQKAVRRSLAARATNHWLDTLEKSSGSAQVSHDHAMKALDATRNEAPTRQG